ncbi:PREDICTED: carbonic anhydrase 2-like [Fragaria vesca subsp. vesca]
MAANGATRIDHQPLVNARSMKNMQTRKDVDFYGKLATAQSPKFMLAACSDSRVCPSHILNFQPGEVFVVRNIANIVPPFGTVVYTFLFRNVVKKIELCDLQVENICVIGHSCCGGIKALMSIPDDVTTDRSDRLAKQLVRLIDSGALDWVSVVLGMAEGAVLLDGEAAADCADLGPVHFGLVLLRLSPMTCLGFTAARLGVAASGGLLGVP